MANRRDALIRRRQEVGLSQEALAETLGVSRSAVARWETGGGIYPRHRIALARALNITTAELAYLLGDDQDQPHSRSPELVVDGRDASGSIGAAELAELRRDLSRLGAEYDSQPSTSLLPVAGEVLGRVALLSSQSARESVRRELQSLEAEASILMGILVWDSSRRRQNTAAQGYLQQAVLAARSAGDALRESYAQLRLSFVELYGRKDPAMGLIAAEEARRQAPRSSWVLNGLTTLHMAEAYAMAKRRRECDRALTEAERCFGRVKGGDDALRYYSASQLDRMAGSCYLFLGQPKQAVPILEAAAASANPDSKSRAIVLGNLGLAHARQGAVDEAVGVLHQATDVLEGNRGGGGMNVVFSAALELRPWRELSAVQDVHDRLLGMGGS